jgi:hypothetical protein
MAHRATHRFQFTAEKIHLAAAGEAKYHAERADWWGLEYHKAVAAAKEKGVQVREYEVTGGKRADLMLDPALQNRMSECASKRTSHQQAADRFTIEAATYGSQAPGVTYDLDGEDVMYFRLAGGSRAE